MPTQIGMVTRHLPHGLTEVLTERRGACGGCRPGQGCGSCLVNAKIKAKVQNSIGAQPGDIVKIHMDSRAVYYSAMILYGPPLGCLLAGAIIGASMGSAGFKNESLLAALFGLLGIGIGFWIAVVIGNSSYAKLHFTPTIIQVLKAPTHK